MSALASDPNTSILGHHQVVRYKMVRVLVSAGPDVGLSVEGAGNTLRIGSAQDNDLVLNDSSVSRRHLELVFGQQGVRIIDNDSTNGVFLGKVRIQSAELPPPFELKVGETTLSISPKHGVLERYQTSSSRFGDLLGSAPPMLELFADLERIANAEVSLLVEGETGTGKELVAESVHRESPRAQGPFVVFDCSAVAPSLVESELFGHERGAFTGAHAARAGVFEQAHGGTIFLDELGELPLELQAKLLRVLEKREVRRLGSNQTRPISVRLISATNRNLEREVQNGNFRQDLYFRVAGAHVRVPALRERMEELPLLIDHFLKELSPGKTHRDLPPDSLAMLRTHRWPGNVRELRNAVQRMLITPSLPLSPISETRPKTPPSVAPLRVARRDASDQFERDYLAQLLARSDGNVTRAAAIAEVSRQMIQKLMRRHGIV